MTTKQRTTPWNKFHNEFKKESILANVSYIQRQKGLNDLFTIYIPFFALGILTLYVIVLALSKNYSKERIRPAVFTSCIIIVGSTISILGFNFIHSNDNKVFASENESTSISVVKSISEEIFKNVQAIDGLRQYFGSDVEMTRERFAKMADHWIKRKSSIHAIGWVREVGRSDRNKFEDFWRKELNDSSFCFTKRGEDGRLVRVEEKNNYYPVFFIEPFESNIKALGYDLSSNESRKNSLLTARTSGDYACTDPITLVQDTVKKNGLLIYSSLSNENNEFNGYLSAVVKINKLINASLNLVDLDEDTKFEIVDVTGGKEIEVYSNITEKDTRKNIISKNLPIMDKVWRVDLYSSEPSITYTSKIILILGFSITFSLAFYIFRILNSNSIKLMEVNKDLVKNRESLAKKVMDLKVKNDELEQFAYIASHDLQEPLKSVIACVDRLNQRSKGELSDKSVTYLTHITNSSNRMSQLIKGLLEYSRIGKNVEFAVVDLDRVIKEIEQDLEFSINENSAYIEYNNLGEVSGYELELRLLFQNLISNALKFKKENVDPHIVIKKMEEGAYWRFSISDNGIGMDERDATKIFGIFQRLNNRSEYEGSGIGLAHCKKIVNMHGGDIFVESTGEKGTTFVFTILKKLKQ